MKEIIKSAEDLESMRLLYNFNEIEALEFKTHIFETWLIFKELNKNRNIIEEVDGISLQMYCVSITIRFFKIIAESNDEDYDKMLLHFDPIDLAFCLTEMYDYKDRLKILHHMDYEPEMYAMIALNCYNRLDRKIKMIDVLNKLRDCNF